MITGYTIQATAPAAMGSGAYYLVNGWYKYYAFWVRVRDVQRDSGRYLPAVTFKTAAAAKSSLTKLLKIMPDYRGDAFELCEIHDDGGIFYAGGVTQCRK